MSKRKKSLTEIARKFKRDMQKIVNDSKGGITGISIEADGEKITIAEKKQEEKQ